MKYKWQLGYRLLPLSCTRYNTPYVDLPTFEATKADAYDACRNLIESFPRAEWRLVECR